MNKRHQGTIYEEKAADYLRSLDIEILEMNYRCRVGEIDIIAKDKHQIIFAEVKHKSNNRYGHPAEMVNYYKQKQIVKVSKWYIMDNRLYGLGIRYDVIVFKGEDISYYKEAFYIE